VHRQRDGTFREGQWPCHDIRFVTDFSPQRPGFDLSTVRVRFMPYLMAMGQVTVRVVLSCEMSFHQRPVLVMYLISMIDSEQLTSHSSNRQSHLTTATTTTKTAMMIIISLFFEHNAPLLMKFLMCRVL
jgi:hypothetical protein